jgi:acetoin utilization deacetylase AcuC-like enzyme|tara:strand:+ start:30 stop:959 length:930 start_codon:yes stop_codon:yes gene_type:complete
VKTGLIFSNSYQNHDTGPGHPEQIARVSVIIEKLRRYNNNNILWKKPSIITDDIIKDTHDDAYVDLVKNSFPTKGFSSLDGDTIISPGSKEATFDAAASIITAIDGVQNKEFKNAFCSVRPPGHHCNQNKAAGFCILNNVAIGAKYLLKKYKYKRIAIIDFDVHHGNGTQDIFYDNKNVLFISTHQYPYYPGTGSEKEKGKFNNICNIPLPAGTNSEEYLNAFEFALKKLRDFKPEFILISAGFDGHNDDPLAQFKLDTDDYYKITKRILETSKKFSNGKVVSILEGGYDLQALQDSAKRHVDALLEFN